MIEVTVPAVLFLNPKGRMRRAHQLWRNGRSKTSTWIGVPSAVLVSNGNRVAEAGSGRTVNISSSGVWFTTDAVLSTGLPVELSMSWPARLNDVCPMKLMIYGCVVRSSREGSALAIERYEFRTQGTAALPLYEETGIRLPT
jgi:hypothetical protein